MLLHGRSLHNKTFTTEKAQSVIFPWNIVLNYELHIHREKCKVHALSL